MYLELKSFFSNKIIRLVLIASIILSGFYVYTVIENGDNVGNSINYIRRDIVEYKKYYDDAVTSIEMYTPTNYRYLKDEAIKARTWEIEARERKLDLLLDGYRKNEQELRKLSIYFNLYYMSLQADYENGYKYSTQVFKDEIENYLDLSELPFDLYALEDIHNVSWSNINSIESEEYREALHKAHEEQRKTLERDFFLLKNNLREVDSASLSPWTYLAYTYSSKLTKVQLFVPLLIMLSTYMLIYARKEKSLDLIKLKADKKSKIYTHYLKIILSLSLIILLVPDLLAIIFMGIKNGFYGLKNPIGIYVEGLKSLYPYENLGIGARVRGLGQVNGIGYYPNGDIIEFPRLTNIEFYKFLLLSTVPSILKLVFFISLGVSIGLLIKNNTISLLVSSLITLFTVLSASLNGLKTPYNIFSLDSGWNITLGHTNFSWLGSVLGLSLGIIIVVAVSLLVLNKGELD
ncbi:hypothetical protein [Neofamilia massiliensis]|uniref:hypothetical protein n=1 Tax=Neofamilia massiliensis TaxID=1673724 RepID=UPI0006BB7370|nr:hypothetical protein [Neofamilia massiliensis]